MRRLRRLTAILTAAALGALASPTVLAQDATGPQDELIEVAPGAYAFVASNYVSLVVVTDEGVIVTEPASQFDTGRAARLEAAVGELTDQPVRYVIYSHDHADHSTGGDVFADTATFISHRDAAPKLAARAEAVTPVPDLTFSDAMTLELGGTVLELRFMGRNHSDNSIVVLLPEARVAHAVDFIPIESLPFQTLPDAYPTEWIESLRAVEALDFDILVAGHPPVTGTKEDVVEMRGYLEALGTAVEASRTAGHADGSPEMVEAVRAALEPTYGTWANFDAWLPLNIEGLIAGWARADAAADPSPAP
ncbi:MAG: MBL fold metallo-hydrolase [Chloroflexi bacterium]|nr:MBL fold metallo-hydrolase [Chloroflexota bacterium]